MGKMGRGIEGEGKRGREKVGGEEGGREEGREIEGSGDRGIETVHERKSQAMNNIDLKILP